MFGVFGMFGNEGGVHVMEERPTALPADVSALREQVDVEMAEALRSFLSDDVIAMLMAGPVRKTSTHNEAAND